MTDNQETSADIIAEIRALSNPISDGIIAINGRSIADRLEAAIRREKAAIEADALAVGGMVGAAHRRELSKNVSKNGADFGQLGDCAKLREALIKARSAICEHAKYRCVSLKWENSNLQANCGDILCSWRGLCEAKTAINAALAATEKEGGAPCK